MKPKIGEAEIGEGVEPPMDGENDFDDRNPDSRQLNKDDC